MEPLYMDGGGDVGVVKVPSGAGGLGETGLRGCEDCPRNGVRLKSRCKNPEMLIITRRGSAERAGSRADGGGQEKIVCRL